MQNFPEHDQPQSSANDLVEFQRALSLVESLREPVLRGLGGMALSSAQIAEILEKTSSVRQGLGEVFEVGQAALQRAQEVEAAAQAAAEAAETARLAAAETALAEQTDYGARVLRWVEANRRTTFSIGHIAEKHLPEDEFERLKNVLNANPLLTYLGQGWYELDVSSLNTEPAPVAAETQLAPETAGRPEPEAPAPDVAEMANVYDKQRILFERVEEYAWNRGAFSADDLRDDPVLLDAFTGEELRTIGKSLPALRKLVLERVKEAGGNARWMSEKIGGKTKYVLAFYTRPERASLAPYASEETAGPESPKPQQTNPKTTESPAKNPFRRARRRKSVETEQQPAVPGSSVEKLVEPERPAYDVVGLLGHTGETRLEDEEAADARRQIVALFGDATEMPRDDMLSTAALRWGVSKDSANKILQVAYRLRLIGRLPDSPDVFSVDPSQRRRRGKAGSVSGSQETSSSGPEEIDLLKLGFEGIMNYLAGQQHIEILFTPAAIAQELGKEGSDITRDTVKTVARRLSSVFEVLPPSGSMLKIGLKSRAVKAAWKRDRPGFIAAVRDGKVDEYLAAFEPRR